MFTKRTTTALAALALAGLLGACGDNVSTDAGPASIDESASGDSGDSDGSGGGGTASNEDRQDAVLEYAQCMRDQGIDMPDPEVTSDGGIAITRGDGGSGGGGPMGPRDDEAFQAANEECGHIMEDVRGDMEPADPEEVAKRQDQMTALAECMRDKGHDFPDPQVDDSGRVQVNAGDDSGGEGAGPPSEELEDDMEDCHEEVGLEGPGEGGMTSRSEG